MQCYGKKSVSWGCISEVKYWEYGKWRGMTNSGLLSWICEWKEVQYTEIEGMKKEQFSQQENQASCFGHFKRGLCEALTAWSAGDKIIRFTGTCFHGISENTDIIQITTFNI